MKIVIRFPEVISYIFYKNMWPFYTFFSIVILVTLLITLLALCLLCLLKFSSCCPKDLEKHQKLTIFDSVNIHDSEMAITTANNNQNSATTNLNESLDSIDGLDGQHNQLTRTATGISGRSKNMSQTSIGNSSSRRQSGAIEQTRRPTKFWSWNQHK